MNNRKLKWPEAILKYLLTRATPVDGDMVWVPPPRRAEPAPACKAQHFATRRSLHGPA